MRVLIAEATRRGDTLVELATHLGVTYRRVAQWRSKQASVANAGRGVFVAAAKYLGVPTAFILCIADVIRMEDLTVQTPGSELASIERGLQRMRNDARLAGFVPEELLRAEPRVKALVLFMYRELVGSASWLHDGYGTFEWVRVLHSAVMRTLENEAHLSSQIGPSKQG